MDGKAPGEQGTGLADVFRSLADVPEERLLSLTFQLGRSPGEVIVHALCLLRLRREQQGLAKLGMLKERCLANHLAEKWRTSGGQWEDFRDKCGAFQAAGEETLASLARIFKVLSEQRLCDPLLRDLAYFRALSANGQKTSDHTEYKSIEKLREEAEFVCGAQFAEWMCSSRKFLSGSLRNPEDSTSATLKRPPSQDESQSHHSLCGSLHTDSSIASYPTHLEISLPPTAPFQRDTVTPVMPDHAQPRRNLSLVNEENVKSNTSGPSNSPAGAHAERKDLSVLKSHMDSKTDVRSFTTLVEKDNKSDGHVTGNQKKTAVPLIETKPALISTEHLPPTISVPKAAYEKTIIEEEEEEEKIFYSFVILHAAEDFDMAESMRERLESLGVGTGATYSEHFAIPGKGTLMCVEDAINNSAFTILLLTRNFKTRLLEVETESALINSMNHKHKFNTVIPLLPQENCMSKQNMPMILQAVVPLVENKSFDKRIKKALSPARIESMRRLWFEEQRVKDQVRRQETLRLSNRRQEQLIREQKKAKALEQEKIRLLIEQQLLIHGPPLDPRNAPYYPASYADASGIPPAVGGDGRLWWPPQSSIHIENAKYIMIGNDSQMTVELSGVNDDGLADSEDKE
ncbi:TIR domain-containing adapter molecule 1 [Lampris incognitus]|uniref:TIR domain-containing adapter molecule 1 n=1 Tax=Lampris incognitus TaxID=2546036 RepID=UPI0024B5C257|nr:TIR domain-containing adapter molecule 1 [Lampris incognitus]